MHELPWITNFCHSWGDSAMIFTRDFVTRENHCRIASLVTKNRDFKLVTKNREAIRQWFSLVTSSLVKIIVESPHSWQKSLSTVTNVIFYFLHAILCHEHINPLKLALISPLLPRAAFSDRALWRHHNWFVTSCEREILVWWRHICLLSLHAQIGAKVIFTSE